MLEAVSTALSIAALIVAMIAMHDSKDRATVTALVENAVLDSLRAEVVLQHRDSIAINNRRMARIRAIVDSLRVRQ